MLLQKKPLLAYALAFVLILALLGAPGCATPSPPVAVTPPRIQVPPVPDLVQTTPAKPAGWFQLNLKSFFSSKPAKPTTSTQPTHRAERTP